MALGTWGRAGGDGGGGSAVEGGEASEGVGQKSRQACGVDARLVVSERSLLAAQSSSHDLCSRHSPAASSTAAWFCAFQVTPVYSGARVKPSAAQIA